MSPVLRATAALLAATIGTAQAATYDVHAIMVPAGLRDAGLQGITPRGIIYDAGFDGTGFDLFAGSNERGYAVTSLGVTSLYQLVMDDAGQIVGETFSSTEPLFTGKGTATHFFKNFLLHLTMDNSGDAAGSEYNPKGPPGPLHGVYKIHGGQPYPFRVFGAESTQINAINGEFVFSGAYTPMHAKGTPGISIGYVWKEYVATPILPPGRGQSSVLATNPAGANLVVAFGDGQASAGYLNIGDSYTQIEVPGATSTSVVGLNARNEVYGLFQTADGVTHAYVYHAGSYHTGTYTTIDAPNGRSIRSVSGLSTAGTLVGRFWINPAAERSRGFYAVCHGSGC